MFHGTRSVSPYELIASEEGFDIRYANQGLWGYGIYFAEQANNSDNFAHKIENTKVMILATVILGVSVKLEADKTLRMPPKAEIGIRYDSVRTDNGIFVVYENGRALPEYIITYQ